MSPYEIFEAGDVLLQSGKVQPGVMVAYRTHGHLNAVRDNASVRFGFAKLCLWARWHSPCAIAAWPH